MALLAVGVDNSIGCGIAGFIKDETMRPVPVDAVVDD